MEDGTKSNSAENNLKIDPKKKYGYDVLLPKKNVH